MNKINIKCDECEHIFNVELVEIIKKNVMIKDIELFVTFFRCPKCNKIYVCNIQESQQRQDILEIQDYQKKIENAMKYNNISVAKNYAKTMQVKKKRLEKRNKALRAKYIDIVLKELEQTNQKGE